MWFKKEELRQKVKVGDTIEITGHNQFPGQCGVPIGTKIKVDKVIPLHNAVEYQWGKDPSMNWWILPEDYTIVESPLEKVTEQLAQKLGKSGEQAIQELLIHARIKVSDNPNEEELKGVLKELERNRYEIQQINAGNSTKYILLFRNEFMTGIEVKWEIKDSKIVIQQSFIKSP